MIEWFGTAGKRRSKCHKVEFHSEFGIKCPKIALSCSQFKAISELISFSLYRLLSISLLALFMEVAKTPEANRPSAG